MADEYTQTGCFATLPRTTRGLPLVLGSSPDGSKFIYCNGNSVIMRQIQDPSECEIYAEHSTLTTVAKFSPSGYYAASGDQSGKIRIWDTTQTTHILKGEYCVLAGSIRDISWSEDSKRVAVVGEGQNKFGHVFLFDTGTSNGNLSGQSRSMSSIDFRPTRPYRLISGSEDNSVAIFEGPPFKFKNLFHEHSRFVHCVRYKPDGSVFASAGADRKVILFDGTDGQMQGQLLDPDCKETAHNGGVFSVCWSPDGQKLLTASGDRTCKIWNAETRQLEKTFSFGKAIEDQQLGCLWLKSALISINLAGFINFLDPENPEKPIRIVKGHNKPITAMAISPDSQYVFTGDFEGNITRWKVDSGECERVQPQLHKSQISGLTLSSNGLLVSVGWDDAIAFTKDACGSIDSVHPSTIKLSSQPRGISLSSDGSSVLVACHRSVCVFSGETLKSQLDNKYESTSVAIHPEGKLVAVGGQDNKVHVMEMNECKLQQIKELPHSGSITSVAFSPDGKFLAATDSARKVVPYAVSDDFSIASKKEWTFHRARVNSVGWSQNSRYLVSGGLDTDLMVWDMENTGEHPIVVKGAHAMSAINGVGWLGTDEIVTVGQDSNVKKWKIKL